MAGSRPRGGAPQLKRPPALLADCTSAPAGSCNRQGPKRRLPSGAVRHGRCFQPPFMTVDYAIGLALSALLLVYLVYALLKQERF